MLCQSANAQNPGPVGPVPASFVPLGPYAVNVVYNVKYAVPISNNLIECLPVAHAGQWTGAFPAIVLIHGGGWTGGSNGLADGYSGTWCTAWASWGFAAFAINYTMETGDMATRWPQPLVDAQAAVRWVRGNAAALNVNPAMIGAEGDSAGGQIALLLAYTQTSIAGNLASNNAGAWPSVQFVISEFGPWNWGPGAPYQPGAPSVEAATAATALLVASASGVGYNTTDTMFLQGTQDNTVPPSQSIAGDCLLSGNRRPVHYLSYPGGHEFSGMDPSTWGAVVGQLQLRTIAFGYAHAHYFKALPASLSGPLLSFDDPTPPVCG